MRTNCVGKSVKDPMKKKLLLCMYALDYIPSACNVEALLHKLEEREVVKDHMFVDKKKKNDKDTIFKSTYRFKLELYPFDFFCHGAGVILDLQQIIDDLRDQKESGMRSYVPSLYLCKDVSNNSRAWLDSSLDFRHLSFYYIFVSSHGIKRLLDGDLVQLKSPRRGKLRMQNLNADREQNEICPDPILTWR